jgi:hypothetical protein
VADVEITSIPPPPKPVGSGDQPVQKQGIPRAEAQRYNRASLTGRDVRANYGDYKTATDPAELALSGKVIQLFQDARAYRRPMVTDWRRWDAVMKNRTWMSGATKYMPQPEIPEVRPIISSLVAYLSDSRPGIELAPAMVPNTPQAEFWQQCCWDLQTVADAITHNELSELELTKAMFDAFRYGTGILKTTWDQTLNGGLGEARIDRVNPYCFYPDPHATSDRDGNYFIEARRYSLQELDRRFPGAGSKIRSGQWHDIDEPTDPIGGPNPKLPRANPGAITGQNYDGQTAPANPQYGYGLPGQSNRGAESSDLTFSDDVVLIECWVRTHQHVNPPIPDQRQPTSTVESWRVICVVGNCVLLDSDAKDLYGHPNHPYSRYVCEDEGDFWGQSMVELLAPSQVQINKSLASITHNLDLLGNPVLKENQQAQVSRQLITNKPGQRVLMGNGGEVDWLDPPPIHPLHLDLVKFFIEEMERISGYNAVSRAQSGGGRNSTDVVNSMQEAGFVRIRLALRNLEYSLRGVYTRLCDLVVENYSAPRILAIAGEDGEPHTIALRARHFQLPSENGAIPLRYNILVNAGSALPVSRSAYLEQMNFLFSVGAIDRKALLEAHRVPKWQLIDKRVQAEIDAGMQAEQSARTQGRA